MANRREAILQASATAIAERGVRGLRVNDIADVAGVSPGLLYYHFKDRDGLLSAALGYINEMARGYRTDSDTKADSARARLVAQALNEFQDRKDVVELSLAWNELRAAAVYEPSLQDAVAASSLEWTTDMADLIREAKTAGEVPDDIDADGIGLIITALTDGLAGRWLAKDLSTHEAREHLARALDALVPATS